MFSWLILHRDLNWFFLFQLADNKEVFDRIRKQNDVDYSVLVPNIKGYESAVSNLQFTVLTNQIARIIIFLIRFGIYYCRRNRLVSSIYGRSNSIYNNQYSLQFYVQNFNPSSYISWANFYPTNSGVESNIFFRFVVNRNNISD